MAATASEVDPQQLLNKALTRGNILEILRCLDDSGIDLNHRYVGQDLQTALMRMCHMQVSAESLVPVLEKLESCDWNPNVQDTSGRTLLMHACIADRLNVVLLCLDHVCELELTDRDGNSALVYAVRYGSEEILGSFLERAECRSLLFKANNLGQRPLDIAFEHDLNPMAMMMSDYLAPSPQPKPSGHLPSMTLKSSLSPRSPLALRSPKQKIRPVANHSFDGHGLKATWTSQQDYTGQSLTRQNGGVTIMTTRAPSNLHKNIAHVSTLSPRKSSRTQRLLRRETQGIDISEDSVTPGSASSPDKPGFKQLEHSRISDSVSLPDLRDFKRNLVTSGEVTPMTSDNSPSDHLNKSWNVGNENESEKESKTSHMKFLERYKNNDLSASCTLPPLQSSSIETERRNSRGPKLMHGRKNGSTDDVLLRSLIV